MPVWVQALSRFFTEPKAGVSYDIKPVTSTDVSFQIAIKASRTKLPPAIMLPVPLEPGEYLLHSYSQGPADWESCTANWLMNLWRFLFLQPLWKLFEPGNLRGFTIYSNSFCCKVWSRLRWGSGEISQLLERRLVLKRKKLQICISSPLFYLNRLKLLGKEDLSTPQQQGCDFIRDTRPKCGRSNTGLKKKEKHSHTHAQTLCVQHPSLFDWQLQGLFEWGLFFW